MNEEHAKCYFCRDKENKNNLFSFHQECLNKFNEEQNKKLEEISKKEDELRQERYKFEREIKDINEYNYLRSEEFLNLLKEVKDGYDDHLYLSENNVFDYIKRFFNDQKKLLSKHEYKAKMIMEEVKRMLYTLFYISDCLEGTHAEKTRVKFTLEKIIQKQVSFFDKMTDNYYLRPYFNEGKDYNSLVTYFDLQDQNKEKDNKIKQLQEEIKYYKEKQKE